MEGKTRIIIIIAASVVLFIGSYLFFYLTDDREVKIDYTREDMDDKELGIDEFDFIVRDVELVNTTPKYYLLRERTSKWNDEQIKKFWIEPKDILIDILRKENEKKIEELLEKIE